jgi:pimeloyl-ACP methyl ester carboxylesterase
VAAEAVKRRIAFVVVLLAVVVAWQPLIRPGLQAGVIVSDIYSTTLWNWNAAALVTPPPRVSETRERFAGTEMRVSWWRPGWGDRHPAIMLANGATRAGNDDPETRRLAEALARGGYLVMLPEFAFLKEGRLEPGATAQMDAAFVSLRALRETADRPAGAFGFSIGGGILLAAAGRGGALAHADYLAVLGTYYDLDTYLASVAGGTQPRGGRLEPWPTDAEVRDRLPAAALAAVDDEGDRAALRAALDAGGYDTVLARLRQLPRPVRATLEELSPRTTWATLRPPVFWLHDANDRFEPIAEAEAALAAPRDGRTELAVSHLVSHAAPLDEGQKTSGLGFWLSELRVLMGFGLSVLRAGGS